MSSERPNVEGTDGSNTAFGRPWTGERTQSLAFSTRQAGRWFLLCSLLVLGGILFVQVRSASRARGLTGPNAAPPPQGQDSPLAQGGITVTVHDTVVGTTTAYIGATEGGSFDVNDLVDCGIGTYRIWIGMSDVEYCDDDDPRGYTWGCDQAGNAEDSCDGAASHNPP